MSKKEFKIEHISNDSENNENLITIHPDGQIYINIDVIEKIDNQNY